MRVRRAQPMGCKALAVRMSTQDWSFEYAQFIHIYIPYIMLIQKLNKCLTKQRTVAWAEMQLTVQQGNHLQWGCFRNFRLDPCPLWSPSTVAGEEDNIDGGPGSPESPGQHLVLPSRHAWAWKQMLGIQRSLRSGRHRVTSRLADGHPHRDQRSHVLGAQQS